MQERIIYTLISKGGGIDGRDFNDKGGKLTAAFWTRAEAEKAPGAPWNNIVPEVVDIDARKASALAKLDPVDKLALGLVKGEGPWR